MIRKLPRNEGEFTCMANMLRFVSDKIVTQIPSQATHVVIDVSGDGMDNCNGKETTDVVRDELVAYGAVINGLPIIERAPTADAAPLLPDTSRSDDLKSWYRNHVMGGAGAFVLPAYGYEDFGRAMRQKGTVTVTHWLGADRPCSVGLWISSHTTSTAIRASSSSRPSGSISASL